MLNLTERKGNVMETTSFGEWLLLILVIATLAYRQAKWDDPRAQIPGPAGGFVGMFLAGRVFIWFVFADFDLSTSQTFTVTCAVAYFFVAAATLVLGLLFFTRDPEVETAELAEALYMLSGALVAVFATVGVLFRAWWVLT
jgi:hypothetical protein